LPVPGPDNARDADFHEISSNLSEGLRTCRSVVQSYRVLLIGDQPDVSGPNEPPATVIRDIPSDHEDETLETSST
jgi:hypothetical protein